MKGGSARLLSRKKGKICTKGKSFAGRRAGSRAAEAARVPEKHPDAAGPCPSLAASANGGKTGFKPKGAGPAVPSLAWFVLLEQRASPGKGALGGSALPVGPAWVQGMVTASREEPLHPGQTLLQLWDGAHTGREGERGTGPSAPSSGDKAKEQSVGTSRWLCPVPAPPRGPRVAAMPRTRSDRSSRAVNALNSQGFGSSHGMGGAL